MPNPEHVARLLLGFAEWNRWRKRHSVQLPDLSDADLPGVNLSKTNLLNADLSGANLSRADLSKADLSWANLASADLWEANLSMAKLECANLSMAQLGEANLSGADLSDAGLAEASLQSANLSMANLRKANLPGANLSKADLSGANLSKAKLWEANLSEANLAKARLNEADLSKALLVETNFSGAELNGARVYGVSVWNVALASTKQNDLVITREDEAEVTVDNLEVAQFIYLLLNNPRIRDVIDTVAKKAVLILGRFSSERKAVLDAVRVALRSEGYVPIVFDFEKPARQDLTGTIQTLAHLARFVIADLTDPRCVPHELMAFVPNTIVPVKPVILGSQNPYVMFGDLRKRHHWLLAPFRYKTPDQLIAELYSKVIGPAETKAKKLFGD